MLIVHADRLRVVRYVEQGDVGGLASYLAQLIQRLAQGGADVAAVSAVTPHICIRELLRISPLPLIDIIEVVNQEVRARGYRRVSLFGTRFVVESRMFGMLEGVEVVDSGQVEAIHDAYMETVEGRTGGRAVLSRIAHELSVDAVILAGTDLSLIFDESNTDFPHLDCTSAHVQAIVRSLRTEDDPAKP